MRVNEAYQTLLAAATEVSDSREAKRISGIILEDLFGVRNPFRTDTVDGLTAPYVQGLCDRIRQGEPVQYITGKAYFYEWAFGVSRAVLIPRPETEELVHQILQDNPKGKPLRLLDIGTGSGCISISLALKRPNWEVTATDVSSEALAQAHQNAASLSSPVRFLQNDITNSADWEALPPVVDIVVSNPPYIPEREKTLMPSNVLDWEPHLALFSQGAAERFYALIADMAWGKLAPGGRLYFEINEFHGDAISLLLEQRGYSDIRRIKDMQGKERIMIAVKK